MSAAIVAGVLAGKARNGGNAWTRLSFLLGLRRLGFDVLFAERLHSVSDEGRRFFESVCSQFGIDGVLFNGAVPAELDDRASDATILINISGHLGPNAFAGHRLVRVFLDDDPGYTQLWHSQGLLGNQLAGHDFYYTFGQNIGHAGCSLPTGDISWHPIAPPVVLEEWPVIEGEDREFTTVASWRGGYGRVEGSGHLYGQKAHEFRRYVDVPRRVAASFEIALDIEPADAADADLMRMHGWRLSDPCVSVSSPDTFREYVQRSKAEFSVAQGIYVETNSGWFSDRTTRYLASGKPALVQDTGFSKHLPSTEGLVAFSRIDQAVAGAEAILRDYQTHAETARAIAVEYFDSDKVLGHMLEEVGL